MVTLDRHAASEVMLTRFPPDSGFLGKVQFPEFPAGLESQFYTLYRFTIPSTNDQIA